MSLELELSNTSVYKQQLNFVEETASQLIKDFDAFGYEIRFSGNAEKAYTELSEQVNPLIEHLVNTNYQKLLSVLYRIDINEQTINQELSAASPFQFAEIITHLVIERELKKVIIRNYFKNQQNEA